MKTPLLLMSSSVPARRIIKKVLFPLLTISIFIGASRLAVARPIASPVISITGTLSEVEHHLRLGACIKPISVCLALI